MSSFGILSGDPSELEGMLSEMCIKKEINDLEPGSKAFYESRIYTNNDAREFILQEMSEPNDDLIALSKAFLASMKEAIRQQNEFIEKFAIQPDPDERNGLKIASKSWFNLLRRQLMRHYNILAPALNEAAAIHDADLLCKISNELLGNSQIERRLGRDSIERYPPASD